MPRPILEQTDSRSVEKCPFQRIRDLFFAPPEMGEIGRFFSLPQIGSDSVL